MEHLAALRANTEETPFANGDRWPSKRGVPARDVLTFGRTIAAVDKQNTTSCARREVGRPTPGSTRLGLCQLIHLVRGGGTEPSARSPPSTISGPMGKASPGLPAGFRARYFYRADARRRRQVVRSRPKTRWRVSSISAVARRVRAGQGENRVGGLPLQARRAIGREPTLGEFLAPRRSRAKQQDAPQLAQAPEGVMGICVRRGLDRTCESSLVLGRQSFGLAAQRHISASSWGSGSAVPL